MIIRYDFFDERYPDIANDEYALMESYDGIFDDYLENSIIINFQHPKYGQLMRDLLFSRPIFATVHGWFPFDNSNRYFRMILSLNEKDKQLLENMIGE